MQRVLEVKSADFNVTTPHGPVTVAITAKQIKVEGAGKKAKVMKRSDIDASMNVGTNRVRKIVENYLKPTPKKS